MKRRIIPTTTITSTARIPRGSRSSSSWTNGGGSTTVHILIMMTFQLLGRTPSSLGLVGTTHYDRIRKIPPTHNGDQRPINGLSSTSATSTKRGPAPWDIASTVVSQWALLSTSTDDHKEVEVEKLAEQRDHIPIPITTTHNTTTTMLGVTETTTPYQGSRSFFSRVSEKIQEMLQSIRILRRLQTTIMTLVRSNRYQQSPQHEFDPAILHTNNSNLPDPIHHNAPPEKTNLEVSTPSMTVRQREKHSNRSAYAASHIDLSGSWRPIVTPEFQHDYDEYLKNCSQSYWFRQVVLRGIQYQLEHITQSHQGKTLEIIATNPVGNWHRTLVSSDETSPINVTIIDPDGDTVYVEAWWDDDGTKHRSWLRGKPRLCGGAMETVRYLESDTILRCESTFHPSPTVPSSSSMDFKRGYVVWKYQRES